MSPSAKEPRLIFFAEGDDADDYFDLIDHCGEAAVIDEIVGGRRLDTDQEGTPRPGSGDDTSFEHDDGYTLIYNPQLWRIWLYESDVVPLAS